MSQSRRTEWRVVQKHGRFAVVTGAAWLVASFALLVLIGASSGAAAAAATTVTPDQAAPASSCSPLSESSGKCYNAGEFCPSADLYMSGVAMNGTPIACEPEPGGGQPHWEACTRATFAATPATPATPAHTAAATPICPVAVVGTATTPSTPTGASASAAPGPTTSGPAGAPATGGGTGRGTSGTLAAAGCAAIVVGTGLVFFSRRRSRRRPA